HLWAFAKHERYDEAVGHSVFDGWRTFLLVGAPLLGSNNLRSVVAAPSPGTSGWQLNLELDHDGAKIFEQATRDHLDQRIAILVDGQVMSAPVVREPIAGGKLAISMGGAGADAEREAKTLAAALDGTVAR